MTTRTTRTPRDIIPTRRPTQFTHTIHNIADWEFTANIYLEREELEGRYTALPFGYTRTQDNTTFTIKTRFNEAFVQLSNQQGQYIKVGEHIGDTWVFRGLNRLVETGNGFVIGNN